MTQHLNCKTHKNPTTDEQQPKKKIKKWFKKCLQDERLVSPAGRAAEFSFGLRQKEKRANVNVRLSDVSDCSNTGRRKRHVTPILHTVTTQLTGGWSAGSPAQCHTSLSTSTHHQLQQFLFSVSDCVTDVLTFIVSLFYFGSSHDHVGVKIVLLVFWNFSSESAIEFLKVYFQCTTNQSRFFSDIHAKRI